MTRPEDRIKIPKRRNTRLDREFLKITKDGQWQPLIPEMGVTSAEQTARAYNVPGGPWQFGYTVDMSTQTGELVSCLWVRWVG